MPSQHQSLAFRGFRAVTSDDLVQALQIRVRAGSVTTYAEVSQWAYGVRTRNQPVRSLLRGAYSNGHQLLTNRVVKVSGDLAALPEGTSQQQTQLQSEGVPFNGTGSVDFKRITPVTLGSFQIAESDA